MLDQVLARRDLRLETLSPAEREHLQDEIAAWLREDLRLNQLRYYRVVNPEAVRVHTATAREVAIVGGRRSTKTGTALAELAIQLTGIIPDSLRAVYPRQKLRPPPVRGRLCVTSLTNAFDVNLKPKLQWWQWNGKANDAGLHGDPTKGHYGLIPATFLPNGDWTRAWSEKHRTLTLTNGSRLDLMSYDQDLQEFDQGAYHVIVEDEIPPEDVHRANKTRVLDYGGQVITGGSPPDDRTAAVTVGWFHDQLYVPGLEGTSPDVMAVTLWTERNATLDAEDVAWLMKGLTPEEREARLHGRFLHLAGLVIRGFTDTPKSWCFTCEASTITLDRACATCGAKDTVTYSHVWDEADLAWPGPVDWPCLFYMDPHQARPTACAWFKVDPQDRWWQIAELEVAGDAAEVKRQVLAFERQHHLDIVWRKGDPKITAQHNQFAGEHFTIRRAFQDVGFDFEEANTNFSVGIDRLEAALRPNRWTRTPQWRVYRGCPRTIYQLGHFSWPAGKRDPQDVKEQPGRKHSDFPAVVRYLAIDDPDYRALQLVQHRTRVSLVGAREGRNPRAGGW